MFWTSWNPGYLISTTKLLLRLKIKCTTTTTLTISPTTTTITPSPLPHRPPPPPSSQSSSRPYQPLSHVSPVADSNDPIARVKVQCIGNQHMRVLECFESSKIRLLDGSKDMRLNFKTKTDNLVTSRTRDNH